MHDWNIGWPGGRAGRCLVASAILALVPAVSAEAAEAASVHWELKPELHVTGMSRYTRRGGDSSAYDTYAATLEFTAYSTERPYWGGVFADYRSSSGRQLRDNLNLGVYFRYNFPRWDHTLWLFRNRSPGNDGTLVYATRSRYRVAGGHKLGIEALAPVDSAGKPRLMLGYYGTPADAISLNVLAGGGTDGREDFAARIELVWHVL